MDFLTHERLFRSEDIIKNRSQSNILVLGAGALGSNLIPMLVRNGFSKMTAVDFDRIDRHNPANQYYTNLDIGRKKTAILKSKIYRELGIDISVIDRKIQEINSNIFKNFDLIIDTFDNWEARKYVQVACREFGISDKLIHAGLSDQGFSEIKWDNFYKIPETESSQIDICEYPLACNLVYFTVSFLSEIICKFVDQKEKRNLSFTLNDLNIHIY